MLLALVSGRKKNKTTKQRADSHVNSQMGQVQGAVNTPPIGPYCTANPPTRGLHGQKSQPRSMTVKGHEESPPHSRSHKRSYAPKRYCVCSLCRPPDISDCGTTGCQHGGTEEAGDETKGKKHSKAGSLCDRDLESNEHCQCAYVDRVSADERNLAH